MTAKYYSLPHECVTYTHNDTVSFLEQTLYHTEAPILNAHCIAKYRLSQFAREKNFVVALTGEGSDEILLGYVSFRLDMILELRSQGMEGSVKADTFLERIQRNELSNVLLGSMPKTTPRVRGIPSWQAWHFHRLKKMCHELKAPGSTADIISDSLDEFASEVPAGLSSVRLAQVDWIRYVF
ncbi:hypothetical protein M422DRAFT_259962 [Sphaerobolus stellatus SS14]|uniref:Asparagine synthetase domain-containing protein n=1 Tax=Sphaerobolus stellatus (strain SS14) TaxID=990650 RepID=A0A0C9V7Q0_SPHS4|nr:hypothetical protein M422DRAFT_259962 [Sphaerobolus stellatus SS14]